MFLLERGLGGCEVASHSLLSVAFDWVLPIPAFVVDIFTPAAAIVRREIHSELAPKTVCG